MGAIGFDCGTYNLVCCQRDEQGNYEYNREVNAFLKLNLKDNRFLLNMMKDKNVPIIEKENTAYVLGEAAVKMAYSMSELELQRPMQDGCVNPKEKEAFEVMNRMIHSLIGDIPNDKTVLYYTVPANAINETTDADYHAALLKNIFQAYESEEGFKLVPCPINEGLALVYAELGDKAYTGFGLSFGSGQVNVCFAIYGAPVFQFSIVNSGDWIDRQAAKAAQESTTFINQEKTKIDLMKPPTTIVERAIQTQYRIMIEKTVASIKKGIEDKKTRFPGSVDFIIAGGTSIPNGFDILFRDVMLQANLPIDIGSVVRPPDPLYSVSRGALIAAENSIN